MPHARLTSPADPASPRPSPTFRRHGHTGRELQDALWRQRIRVRAQGGDAGVRLSAHFYVSPRDIDRVLDVVASMRS
jgi:selenocysteine lyase/cysteine desulfurase